MPVLSNVTATMATVLATRLDTAAVDVRTFDGKFDKDHTTVKAPGVLIACLGFDEVDDQFPVMVDAKFFAVCVTRTPAAAQVSPTMPKRRPRDACADLAALVTRIVKTEPLWLDADDVAQCSGAATKVRASNDYTNSLKLDGHSAWAVTWNQRVEFEPEITDAELTQLSMIHFTLAMGPEADTLQEQLDDDTPDIEIQADLPEDVVI